MIGIGLDCLAVVAAGLLAGKISTVLKPDWMQAMQSMLGLILIYSACTSFTAGYETQLLLFLAAGYGIHLLISKFLYKETKEKTADSGFSQALCFVLPGSLAITGCMEAGLSGNCSLLVLKAGIDFLAVLLIACRAGTSACLAAVPLFVYELLLWLLFRFLPVTFPEMILVIVQNLGAILLLLLAFNMIFPIRISASNFLPSMFLPFLFLL